MPQVIPPPVKPVMSDIQLYARAYFNIELTSVQMEMLSLLASGKHVKELRYPPKSGKHTAYEVMKGYLQAGIMTHGRARLQQHDIPAAPIKLKGVTQPGRILNAIKQPGGAYNWQLSKIALKYTSVISSLRKDGHDIEAIRQYNKHGKATDTWLYICHD